MNRVLLLDTSFAALPVHDWLCQQGLEVWTIGNRPADVLAMRDPDRYLHDNYADIDVVQAHIDRLNISYVVPGCTDISIETALRLTRIKTVFDAPETYHALADKAAFRGLCAELNLPAPRRVAFEDLPISLKLIAKPSDSYSGRGISVFDGMDVDQAAIALQHAKRESRNGEALLETYAEGQLLSYSLFLEGQKVVASALVREDGSITPYAVDVSHLVVDFPDAGEVVLKAAIEKLADHLQLVDGLMHVQFIWDGQVPRLVELSRRCPGDLYLRLVELSTGHPFSARYASYFVGHTLDAWQAPQNRHILRHTITAGHKNYEGLQASGPLPVIEFHALAQTGRTAPSADRIDRVALVFLDYQSEEALQKARKHFFDRDAYETNSVKEK